MSAAGVATSAVGLLDRHYSSSSVPRESHAPEWSGPMQIERSKDESVNPCEDRRSPPIQADDDAQTNSDRRETLGGLLAALATTAVSKTEEEFVPARKSASPPVESPISQTSQDDMSQVNGEGATIGSNNARLPSMEPNLNGAFPSSTLEHDPLLMAQFPNGLQQSPSYDEDMPIAFPDFDMPMDISMQEPLREPTPVNIKRQYDAFARLEFADGIFYLNTYQCELGRDQHAFKDALRREREVREAAALGRQEPQSSSGNPSQPRSHAVRLSEKAIQESLVSDAGGFAGVDEQPIEGYEDKRNRPDGKHPSSQASDASAIVRPAEVLHNPSLAPFDYHKDVIYQTAQPLPVPEYDDFEDEQPAPVTADHMPDPSSCPLIPIHPTMDREQRSEADCMKGISRRHVRILWNWQESAFFMEVLGRNGAFFDGDHVAYGKSAKLYSGAKIQISAVEFTFRLPNVPDESAADEDDDDDSAETADGDLEASPNGTTAGTEGGQTVKLKLKLNTDAAAAQNAMTNGDVKRRGPGRPPKNGVMSQREMKEREKAEKEAKQRVLHGGPSPPALQRKPSKSQLPKPEPIPEVLKQEKRKYTKRKREDGEEEEVLPSIEAQEETPVVEPPLPQQPPAKRARTKSFSPPYKPYEECSQEDLARPPHNYAVLLYMVLSETGEITLRQIYKQMQSRWPYFKYVVDSDGWTSSVRHNLNQEVGKLFERGRKEGKGFTWLPKPNAMEEYQAQKNKRSNAPPAPKPRPPQQRPNFPPSQGQQLTWQNSGPMPQPNRPGEQFVHQGPWPAPNNAGRPPQPGAPAPGAPQQNAVRPMSNQPPNVPVQNNPNYIPPDSMLVHYFGRPAPRFIPVTFEGLAVINRFQQSMLEALPKDQDTQKKWNSIFDSAKKRCLHGAAASLLEGGETTEEATIIEHIKKFMERYRNPAFESFSAARTASPAIGAPQHTPAPPPASGLGGSATPVPTAAQTVQNAPAGTATQPNMPSLSSQSGQPMETGQSTPASQPSQPMQSTQTATPTQTAHSTLPGPPAQPVPTAPSDQSSQAASVPQLDQASRSVPSPPAGQLAQSPRPSAVAQSSGALPMKPAAETPVPSLNKPTPPAAVSAQAPSGESETKASASVQLSGPLAADHGHPTPLKSTQVVESVVASRIPETWPASHPPESQSTDQTAMTLKPKPLDVQTAYAPGAGSTESGENPAVGNTVLANGGAASSPPAQYTPSAESDNGSAAVLPRSVPHLPVDNKVPSDPAPAETKTTDNAENEGKRQ